MNNIRCIEKQLLNMSTNFYHKIFHSHLGFRAHSSCLKNVEFPLFKAH